MGKVLEICVDRGESMNKIKDGLIEVAVDGDLVWREYFVGHKWEAGAEYISRGKHTCAP